MTNIITLTMQNVIEWKIIQQSSLSCCASPQG